MNELPYVRETRRLLPAVKKQRLIEEKEKNPLKSVVMQEVNSERLTATKRIINAYNAGDIESIRDIIYDSTVDMCEIYFSSLQHVFLGKTALFSLWVSLFEAFPNGIFRTSDSVINENKQVFTSFLFFGTKIFPLLIDGMPVELLSAHGIPEAEIKAIDSSSVVVDRSKPIYKTAELLETEDIPEMIFEGRIILQMNEKCEIQKFDFSWARQT